MEGTGGSNTTSSWDGSRSSTRSDHQLPRSRALAAERMDAHSFPGEVAALKTQKPVPNNSHLISLAPEWDAATCLIHVGGRLCKLQNSSTREIHPIVLDPKHPDVKLLIKDMDERLLHPGMERVYAKLRIGSILNFERTTSDPTLPT